MTQILKVWYLRGHFHLLLINVLGKITNSLISFLFFPIWLNYVQFFQLYAETYLASYSRKRTLPKVNSECFNYLFLVKTGDKLLKTAL